MTTNALAEFEEKEGSAIVRAFRQVLLRVSAESADGRSKFTCARYLHYLRFFCIACSINGPSHKWLKL